MQVIAKLLTRGNKKSDVILPRNFSVLNDYNTFHRATTTAKIIGAKCTNCRKERNAKIVV